MMLMPANNSSPTVHYIAGACPGRIGWLVGPSARLKTKLRTWMPFALDNDAYSAWTSGQPWDYSEWVEMLKWAAIAKTAPRWVLVPDVVGDRAATIGSWNKYAPSASDYGWALAFAVQDGMTPADIPPQASVVFVGGTTRWKWTSLPMWTSAFPRIHVGRVNTLDRLVLCERLGCESVDGTGWFRASDDSHKTEAIFHWLTGSSGLQTQLNLT